MTHSYDFYKKHYYFWLFLPIVMSLVLIDSFHTKNIDNKHNRYNQPSFLSTFLFMLKTYFLELLLYGLSDFHQHHLLVKPISH